MWTARIVLSVLLLLGAAGQARGTSSPSLRMVELTNQDRADRDRAPLDFNAHLSRYAARHAKAMAEAGRLFHTPDLAAKLQGLDWSIGGENVGHGGSLEILERAFMHSKVHRSNILRPGFDSVAVGVFRDGNSLWVTVIFYG